jgi:hypothetical protein
LHALVERVLEHVPVERAGAVPLGALAELGTHEQQLLAGMGEHVGVQQPQVGEALPLVARHLVDHRAFAMHHLVVRERQHEVLGEAVQHAEGQQIVVVLAMDRLCAM